MIGNILGAMECFGILGIISFYFFEELPSWGLCISVFLVSFPIIFIIVAFILLNREDKKEIKTSK
jgi:hypothetical protein